MNEMSILLVVAVIVLLGIVAWLVYDRQRSRELRTRFGPEYDRAVEESGSRRAAEADLADRARRVEELHIRPLEPADRQRFASAWREVQGQFVDDPKGAIGGADDLIGQVMEARGYPMANFGSRVDDISVDHGDVVEHYRIAHDVARRADGYALVDTEELRQALVHYRALFTSLLGEKPDDRLTEQAAEADVPATDRDDEEPSVPVDDAVGSRRTS